MSEEKHDARIQMRPQMDDSLLMVVEFLMVVAQRGRRIRLYAFEPGKEPAVKDQNTDGLLKLSDFSDLQIKRGKSWLLLRDQPNWKKLVLDAESFEEICAFADYKEEQRRSYFSDSRKVVEE